MELIMVPGRITFAAILYPQCCDDRTLAVHGLFINLAFGTSVTTPYLFMFVNRLIIAGAIISTRVMISIFVGYYGVHRPADAHRLRYLLFSYHQYAGVSPLFGSHYAFDHFSLPEKGHRKNLSSYL